MRQFLIASLVAILLPTVGFAQEVAGSLKDNMKQLGSLSKLINATISDSTKNQDNASRAAQMVDLFKVVYNQAADGVADVPADQQQAALADFQSLIQQEIDLTTQLAQDFAANDNSSAAAVWQKITDIRHEGHDKYNP
ncbi:MAG TPA: cytochrome b562 [Bdellovibrio sp.]|uniref:cytochrome b562 n=1 Tax=Bdellovibrio sp. TaxID=28201 RepID=UPI002EFB278B